MVRFRRYEVYLREADGPWDFCLLALHYLIRLYLMFVLYLIYFLFEALTALYKCLIAILIGITNDR